VEALRLIQPIDDYNIDTWHSYASSHLRRTIILRPLFVVERSFGQLPQRPLFFVERCWALFEIYVMLKAIIRGGLSKTHRDRQLSEDPPELWALIWDPPELWAFMVHAEPLFSVIDWSSCDLVLLWVFDLFPFFPLFFFSMPCFKRYTCQLSVPNVTFSVYSAPLTKGNPQLDDEAQARLYRWHTLDVNNSSCFVFWDSVLRKRLVKSLSKLDWGVPEALEVACLP
jgi:hypothetical protein